MTTLNPSVVNQSSVPLGAQLNRLSQLIAAQQSNNTLSTSPVESLSPTGLMAALLLPVMPAAPPAKCSEQLESNEALVQAAASEDSLLASNLVDCINADQTLTYKLILTAEQKQPINLTGRDSSASSSSAIAVDTDVVLKRAVPQNSPKSTPHVSQKDKIFSCHLCTFNCEQKAIFNAHMDAHFEHRCVICGYGSRTKGRLNRHIREFHPALAEQMNLNCTNRRTRSSGSNANRKRKKSCSMDESDCLMQETVPCKKAFIPELSEHKNEQMKTDTYSTLESESNSFAPKDGDKFDTPFDESPDNEYADSPSDSAVDSLLGTETDKQNLANKKSTSAKNRKFKCKQCDHQASSKDEFWEHTRSHMKREKMLKCPSCDFATEYKHHLEYHLRNHFNSKPFKCIRCAYSCVNKSMLASHLKSHSNVYQYRCADCSYATKYCHSLKLHLRKYSHSPDKVLNLDGSENPYPIIDVYGTRRGPRPKKGAAGMRLVKQVLDAGTPNKMSTPSETVANVTSTPPEIRAAAAAVAAVAANVSDPLTVDPAEEERLFRLMRSNDEQEAQVDAQLNSIIEQQLKANEAAATTEATKSTPIKTTLPVTKEPIAPATLNRKVKESRKRKVPKDPTNACSPLLTPPPQLISCDTVESQNTHTTSTGPLVNNSLAATAQVAQLLQQSLWSQLAIQLTSAASPACISPTTSSPFTSSNQLNPISAQLAQLHQLIRSQSASLAMPCSPPHTPLLTNTSGAFSLPPPPTTHRNPMTKEAVSNAHQLAQSYPSTATTVTSSWSTSLGESKSTETISAGQTEMNNLLGYSMLLLKMQQIQEPRDRLASNSSRNSSEANSLDAN